MAKFQDVMIVDGDLRETDDGWAVQARVARGGNVQIYQGVELGVVDRAQVRVYRPEDEVFNRDAIASYARKPITVGHPSENVSAENWKDLAVGEIDRDVMRDGEFVSVPLLFRDAKAVDQIKSNGARELSMGYDANIEFRDGVTPGGEEYDAVMSDFRMNHVAVVRHARGGSDLRIGDGADHWGASPITTADSTEGNQMSLRKIMVDGLEVETTDAAATAIKKLQDQIAATTKAADQAVTDHAEAIAAKDADIADRDAKIEKLEAAKLSDADLDARVEARAKLVSDAKRIAKDLKTDGKSDSQIRKDAVAAALGDEKIEGKSEAYIDARFDTLLEDAGEPKADPLKSPLGDTASQKGGDDLTTIYADRNTSLSNAWKGATEQKEA